MTQTTAPIARDSGGNGTAADGVSPDVKRALTDYVGNSYLMLFEDRFTVILDDAGRFQKSFKLTEWLSRFGKEDAEQLVSLKERIEQRLSEISE